MAQTIEDIVKLLNTLPVNEEGDFCPAALLDLFLQTPKTRGDISFFLDVAGIPHNRDQDEHILEDLLVDNLVSQNPHEEGEFIRSEEQEERLREARERSRLITEQNVDYEESLRIDKEKDKVKAKAEEVKRQKQREEDEEKKRLESLERVQNMPIDERRNLFASRLEEKIKRQREEDLAQSMTIPNESPPKKQKTQ